MLRLSSATLASARNAVIPAYDRSGPATIAHIGVGGFARAHLGTYADELLAAGWPASVRGVSLRSRRAEDQLAPQDGLYSLVEREPESDTPLRVLGAITSVAAGVDAAVDAIAAPATALVTLTVTEKGYEVDARDLVPGREPRSAPAVIAHGLARRGTTTAPPIIVSLDNVVDNGDVVRRAVLDVAERIDTSLATWIAASVAFPSSVVDRLVPATKPYDVENVASRLGLCDLAAVVAERHRSWVITDVEGLPPLADVGVQVVGDLEPFQRRKLWLLNGPHSALAYGGLLAGCDTIAEASAHPTLQSFVRQYVADVIAVADLPAETAPLVFAAEAQRRFANSLLGDACLRIAADSSRKFPQRLFPVVRARRHRGLTTARFAVISAAWIAAATGVEVQGRRLPDIDDPSVDELRAAAARQNRRELCRAAVAAHTDEKFVEEVEAVLERLTREGLGVFV